VVLDEIFYLLWHWNFIFRCRQSDEVRRRVFVSVVSYGGSDIGNGWEEGAILDMESEALRDFVSREVFELFLPEVQFHLVDWPVL
jgi:hypothetical protein